ncbi:MAG TPA: permease prefix domain 1-containing protein, partial [Longimicrobiales bacterium]|nr:permease prefix domain 1-containing protein [Longimicrobiales bacterium]
MGKLRRLFHLELWGPPVDDGVDWEIAHHFEERVDELVACGWPRPAAEAEARRAFGDVRRVRRELRRIDRSIDRQMRMSQWLETVVQDVRYGVRGLMRAPGFTISILLTLGLGIGANVA